MSKSTQPNGRESADALAAGRYKKLTPEEHVLQRPDMYIGSVSSDSYTIHVPGGGGDGRMRSKTLKLVPGLLKVIDEILVNASDHAIRLRAMVEKGGKAAADVQLVTRIDVDVDRGSNRITVTNNGDGIDVVRHPDYDDVYVPQMIFGNLLTSTNYDSDKKGAADAERIVGGKNGIGSKATNIFSREFTVSTVDVRRGLRYVQTWTDNMRTASKPSVAKSRLKNATTSVSFVPDLARFGMTNLDDDTMAALERRVHDLAAVTGPKVTVTLNGERIEVRDLGRYADMFLGPRLPDDASTVRVHDASNPRWEVVVGLRPTAEGGGAAAAPSSVSFVNGITTHKGGRHVEHVLGSVVRKVAERAAASRTKVSARPSAIRDALFVMVRATIVSPSFESQAKEELTTPASRFGSRYEFPDDLAARLLKPGEGGLLDRLAALSRAEEARESKKTDGKKAGRVRVPKLDDANWAGGARSGECTLILTEGDSAKSMAIAGLAVVGRDRYGVFPLRGKLINAKDVTERRLADNAELAALKKILGLESGRVYADASALRYGSIMVMTDADVDGSHIKGLLFNMFHALWPSLLKVPGFMSAMVTPIIKVR